MEGLLKTAVIYFFIIPGIATFIIMSLKKNPETGLWLIPVIASVIFSGFMFYLDADRGRRSGFDIMTDITILISVLSSFCIVGMTCYAYMICQKEGRASGSSAIRQIDSKNTQVKKNMES